MILEDDDVVGNYLVHMYGASFNLPFANQVCKTALAAVQESANPLSTEGKES